MSPQLACILGLVVLFVVGTVLPVNMGALAFVLAFVIGGLYVDMPAAAVLAGFPGDLFVTLVGITYLFAIAQNNGTIDWLVRQAVRSVRGHVAAIPWIVFLISGLLTSVGAVSPGAVAIIAPVALRFSQRYRIHPLLMGLMVIHGAQGGGFSPMSVYGSITNDVVQRAHLAGSEVHLFIASLGFNLLVAVVVFFVFGGRSLLARPAAQVETVEKDEPADGRRLAYPQAVTLLGLIVLGVGALIFELNVGLVAITIAVVLTILFPGNQARAVEQVHWSTVLLICGVVTYVSVLQKSGAIDYVGNSVSSAGAPLMGALLLCYVGGIVSAFASTVGVLGAIVPLAVPLLLLGQIDTASVIAALAISSSIVDVSPFSTNGALVLASAHGIDRESLYRQLLAYSAVVVALAPLLAWAVLVLPGF
ncbi:MAG TPA: SLC13 family permease [Steroidobacteraceae bacterium]|nr:SLC13 family permease [Steroidobacteraceae bacterium]